MEYPSFDKVKTQPDTSEQILFFDGICNLCNRVVQYVLRKDGQNLIRFASLQSTNGQKMLSSLHMPTDQLKTFIYKRQGAIHTRSTAFLYLMRDLGGLHRVFDLCWIVPRPLRDVVYDWVSRNRYSLFGKREVCYVPTQGVAGRFLD